MDTNTFTIIAAALATLLGALSLFQSSRVKNRAEEAKTRADEVTLLRDEVGRLHQQLNGQERELAELRHENSLLYRVLRNKGIDIEAEVNSLKPR